MAVLPWPGRTNRRLHLTQRPCNEGPRNAPQPAHACGEPQRWGASGHGPRFADAFQLHCWWLWGLWRWVGPDHRGTCGPHYWGAGSGCCGSWRVCWQAQEPSGRTGLQRRWQVDEVGPLLHYLSLATSSVHGCIVRKHIADGAVQCYLCGPAVLEHCASARWWGSLLACRLLWSALVFFWDYRWQISTILLSRSSFAFFDNTCSRFYSSWDLKLTCVIFGFLVLYPLLPSILPLALPLPCALF